MQPLLQDAKVLTADARQLIAENRVPLRGQSRSSISPPAPLKRSRPTQIDSFLNNEKKLASAILGFQRHFPESQDHVDLHQNPHSKPHSAPIATHLGTRTSSLPSKEEILRAAALPAD
jgi:hypothetical protein